MRTSPAHAVRPARKAVDATEITGEFKESDALADDFSLGGADPDDFSLDGDEPVPNPMTDGEELPSRLGGYEVLKVLGKGGMGAVLLGRQVSLDRKVALKVMHPRIAQNPGFVARFTREAYAAAQLSHHNVVQIYDIGEDKGQHFFSMEFVRGRSLMDLVVEQGKLTPEIAVGYVLQAARGLRQGHNQGMVHRDIKPANLLISEDGIVKVADLGLVKLPRGTKNAEREPRSEATDASGGDPHLTGVGIAVGTPAFMAPEQATDSAGVDGRADIYSLGCSLYVLITGKPPFEGKTAPEVMSKHLTEPVIPPDAIVKRVPKALSAILLQMLAKDPDERYQSMDEVIVALEGFLGVEQCASFSPTEEQADQLEGFANQFLAKSAGGRKRMFVSTFILACIAALVGGAVVGRPALAAGAFGLLVMAPLAYFILHGILGGSVVFGRARLLVGAMRFVDWLLLFGSGLLFFGTLWLLGLLGAWLAAALLAGTLGFALWSLTDKPQLRAREAPLTGARGLCKRMRLQGLGEEALREFVCKFSGPNWEPFFEAMFGYEAKIAARLLRKGNTGEPWRKHGTWREPIVGWADARLEAQRQTRERKYIQKVQQKALEAQGVSKAEAEEQAAGMAAALVDQAAQVKKDRREGRQADLRTMVRTARSRRPEPGFNIAGKKLRSLWLKDFLNEWLGRRFRFALGALLFGLGLMWMQQNQLLTAENEVIRQARAGEVMTALTLLSESAGRPLSLPALPATISGTVDSYRVPVMGLLLLVSAIFFHGWRPSAAAGIGAFIALFGPALGLPEAGPFSPAMLSLTVGAGMILVVGWLLRK